MTERAQPGKFGDYLHALAFRVLCEDRLLQPRRTGLFETEFAGPSDIEEAPVLTMEASPTPKSTPSALARHDAPVASAAAAGIPKPVHSQSAAPSKPTPPIRIDKDRISAAIAPRVDAVIPQTQPAAPTRMPAPTPPAEIESRVLHRDIHSPALLTPSLLPSEEVRVSMPAPPRSPVRRAAYNPATSSLIAKHGYTEVSFSEPPTAGRMSPAASRPEPLPAAMVAHSLPEMRNLAPLFPPSLQVAKEAPAVEITIGRLELRAIAAKAPAAPPRPAAPAPRHTLQEYLTRNTGGRG